MSVTRNPFYLQILQKELAERRKRNPQYSLRAYAKMLGMNSGSLSHILEGKRRLPAKACLTACDKLGLTSEQRRLFIESATGPATQKLRPHSTAPGGREALSLHFSLDRKDLEQIKDMLIQMHRKSLEAEMNPAKKQIYEVTLQYKPGSSR
nr:hypothetical protein CKG001_18050 [Bdellovibrio sp. CKG001]BFD63062.1 hypothetical protein BdHM001_17430 [Bdellovibrio sp. HM001]